VCGDVRNACARVRARTSECVLRMIEVCAAPGTGTSKCNLPSDLLYHRARGDAAHQQCLAHYSRQASLDQTAGTGGPWGELGTVGEVEGDSVKADSVEEDQVMADSVDGDLVKGV
jgi:hypothetical protein